MTRFSQFAAPAILGAALMVGAQGCAHEEPPVAGTSNMLSEGRKTVTATAPHAGTVYVYDDTSHDMVYSGRVAEGDRVRLDAKNNRVMLNDTVALEKDLINDHRYQIFFDKKELTEADMARYRQGGNTTVITPPASGGNVVVQPAQPAQPAQTTPPPAGTNNIYVQPAQPAQPAQSPSGATVIPPPPPQSSSGTTVVQPNGTVVQPGSNGTTVVTPAR
jgi:hypothetical protein